MSPMKHPLRPLEPRNVENAAAAEEYCVFCRLGTAVAFVGNVDTEETGISLIKNMSRTGRGEYLLFKGPNVVAVARHGTVSKKG